MIAQAENQSSFKPWMTHRDTYVIVATRQKKTPTTTIAIRPMLTRGVPKRCMLASYLQMVNRRQSSSSGSSVSVGGGAGLKRPFVACSGHKIHHLYPGVTKSR